MIMINERLLIIVIIIMMMEIDKEERQRGRGFMKRVKEIWDVEAPEYMIE